MAEMTPQVVGVDVVEHAGGCVHLTLRLRRVWRWRLGGWLVRLGARLAGMGVTVVREDSDEGC